MSGLYGPQLLGDSLAGRLRTALKLGSKDAVDALLRRRAPFAPSRRMWPPGVGDFALDGREQVNLMIGLGKLSPEARMVEVQCGVGLRARSLTDWLGPGAKYDGIDTDAGLATWCEQTYAERLDFDFGHYESLDAPLPFADGTKDFVLLWDVLPHLDHGAVVQMLREAHRILLPGGCLFVSSYLLDDQAIAAIAGGSAEIGFMGRDVTGAADPDGLQAQDEEWLLDRVAETGFKHVGIRHGTWSGRADGRSTFDILVARM